MTQRNNSNEQLSGLMSGGQMCTSYWGMVYVFHHISLHSQNQLGSYLCLVSYEKRQRKQFLAISTIIKSTESRSGTKDERKEDPSVPLHQQIQLPSPSSPEVFPISSVFISPAYHPFPSSHLAMFSSQRQLFVQSYLSQEGQAQWKKHIVIG